MMVISDDLYSSVLMKPVDDGADTLYILSGYATATMAVHNLVDLKNIFRTKMPNIKLVIGMTSRDGISLSSHVAFKTLSEEKDYRDRFVCSYVYEKPPVHSKAYVWMRNGSFYTSFIGSANYTQQAFFNKNKEILVPYKNAAIIDYFNEIEKTSIYCNHMDVEEYIAVLHDKKYSDVIRKKSGIDLDLDLIIAEERAHYSGLSEVKVTLMTRNGNPGNPGGALNWGLRDGREPNQAYIPLRAEIAKTDFFPPKKTHFTVLTDDSKVLICTRAQGNYGKAIHTPQNNSILGEYFRNRLKLKYGEQILTEHLEQYGRTDVIFSKIDDETYYMDFSV